MPIKQQSGSDSPGFGRLSKHLAVIVYDVTGVNKDRVVFISLFTSEAHKEENHFTL